MPVLAKFELSTPVFDTTCRGVPGATLRLDGHFVLATGSFGWRVWVESVDPDAFEAGLDADEMVASYERLSGEANRHLYKLELSEMGRHASILPLLGECGGEYVDGERTESVWTIRLRFPTDESLQTFADACASREKESITVVSIRRESSCDNPKYGLTSSQREALGVALERGFFDIPRGTTLSAIADELDVSDQAISERLRRAQKCVFERVLADDTE